MISEQVRNRSKIIVVLWIECTIRKSSCKFWSEEELAQAKSDRMQDVSFLSWVRLIHSMDK